MGNSLPLPVLPDEIIHQILLRIPVKSLLQWKCVCKSWKTLISDPQFAKSHFRISTEDPNMTNQQLLLDLSVRERISSYPLKSFFENSSTPVDPSNMMNHGYHTICDSCNGLLCLYDCSQRCFRLCNPSIKWISKKSPVAFSHDWNHWMITYHGFGYDQVNDNYKVLVVVENKWDSSKRLTKIYTFGDGSWKTIKKFPNTSAKRLGIFVSGALNWMVNNGGVNSNQRVILSFGLEKETYRKVLLPQIDDDNVNMCRLCVLNNCLCVFSETNENHWVVWLMKEYGVVESWTKLIMIPDEKFIWYQPFVDPLFLSKNGVLLLLNRRPKQLVLYNLNSGQLDDLLIGSILGSHLHVYRESLISPRW